MSNVVVFTNFTPSPFPLPLCAITPLLLPPGEQAVVIVITVAVVQEYKSDESLAALSKLAPHHCHVLRDGRVGDIEATALVPGDVVMVSGAGVMLRTTGSCIVGMVVLRSIAAP